MPASARRRRTTLTQVARELGVSPMTVSNAYNRPDQLSADLRRRVLETARRLGYAGPDPLARGLRRGGTGAVGVIYDTPLSYAFEDAAAVLFLRGVSRVGEEGQLGLLLVPGSSAEHRDVGPIAQALVDGFVVYSVAEGDPVLQAAVERRLPLVIVDQPRVDGVSFVAIDDEAAAGAIADHLLDLGHKRIGVVSFALSPGGYVGIADVSRQQAASYRVSRRRLRGYAAAAERRGVPWSDVAVCECPGSTRQLGGRAAEVLLSSRPRPTAIIGLSDELALGAMDAIHRRGLSVPRDVSVIGFDDIPAAAHATPALTTVSQNHFEKGRVAARLLTEQLRGAEATSPHILESRVVVRASTGPPLLDPNCAGSS
jgi:DNA-binding LacI/PurR family transcriptional regulator